MMATKQVWLRLTSLNILWVHTSLPAGQNQALTKLAENHDQKFSNS